MLCSLCSWVASKSQFSDPPPPHLACHFVNKLSILNVLIFCRTEILESFRVCKWRKNDYVPFCIKPTIKFLLEFLFLTLLHSQGSNSWKMLLLLLILVFFFSCAWICVEMDDVSWLLCSIFGNFGNNIFSLLYYYLFVYAHILAMVTSISIILFWLYFHIFCFMYILFTCRTN